jgi:transposase
MALPKQLIIPESVGELKKIQRGQPPYLSIRIQMLVLMKAKDIHTKNGLSVLLAVSANTVQSWKKMYEQGGLQQLLAYNRGGNKKSVIDEAADAKILSKLSDPYEAPRSYKELQEWVDENLVKDINYHTLNKHVKRKYKAKIKVARKSHVLKNEEAVAAFKKNNRKATSS